MDKNWNLREFIMNEFVMLCGIPGSGKSHCAEYLEKEEGYVVHSSDKLREELGDVNDQSKNEEVFKILHQRVKEDLNAGKSVVYDATNLSRRRRVAFLQEIKNIPCRKVCVLIATPWEICLEQNDKRLRRVPDDVMWRMYKSFQMPSVYEGFDKVITFYGSEAWKEYYGNIADYTYSLHGFGQENHHHELTLGKHMEYAGEIVLNEVGEWNDVVYATFSHDIGKPVTKTFFNSKGEVGLEAHYYSHQNCGAYNCLFFKYDTDSKANKEYIALLIESHMKPYMEWKQSEKAKEKDMKMFGEQFIQDVMTIHAADVAAH